MAGQPYSKADQLARAPRPEPKKKWAKPLPFKSKKREEMTPERRALVAGWLDDDPRCAVCDLIVEADPGFLDRRGLLDPGHGRVRPP